MAKKALSGASKASMARLGKTIGKKIQAARREQDITAEQLAEMIDISQPHMSRLENGGTVPSLDKILEIAKVLEIPASSLLGDEFGVADLPHYQTRPIRVVSSVQAGLFTDIPLDSWEEDPVFSTKKVSDSAFGLVVQGDSMAERFQEGDVIIVDPEKPVYIGDLCVVTVRDEAATFKRYNEMNGYIVLEALNPKYEAQLIKKDGEVPFRIVGKVVDVKVRL